MAELCRATEVEVGGKVETEKGTKADRFEIGKRGRIRGPLVAERVKIGDKAEADDIYAGELQMGDDASARNIYAKRAILGSDCRVSGELLYVEELRVGEDLRSQSEPKKVERLPEPPI